MTGKVIAIDRSKGTDDVAATLRKIADDIEAGKLEWPVTTAVLICGHTEAERRDEDGNWQGAAHWTTYGLGPRTDIFTVRGLMHAAMCKWEG